MALGVAVESTELTQRSECCGGHSSASDPQTESLLRSIATVLINSRGGSSTCAQKSQGRVRKNVEQLPHRDEHPRDSTVCSLLCNPSCVARLDPVCHDCSHETLCANCVLRVEHKKGCSNDSSSSVGPVCVTAEVNIVEEEQSMWRRDKKRNETSGGHHMLLLRV